ncbi:hypothetical protein [Kitasatospora azatica]|uniref:hypothetical protein n=1 Tax=Kitasatospora azatica TaxID=58347 RepID=UPI00056445EF|nr:hypothetical protein [Kitasatospora azatica]
MSIHATNPAQPAPDPADEKVRAAVQACLRLRTAALHALLMTAHADPAQLDQPGEQVELLSFEANAAMREAGLTPEQMVALIPEGDPIGFDLPHA